MSKFLEFQTNLHSMWALRRALIDVGFKPEHLLLFDKPEQLRGYHDDLRQEKAHLHIKKEGIGGSSNDIGFVKNKDGTIDAIISDFDKSAYNQIWLNKVTQLHNKHILLNQCKKNNWKITEKTNSKNEIILSLEK